MKIAERMGTRTTEECAMIWGDQKHDPWFQPYYKYKAGKCKCCEEVKARGLCRHKSQRAKLHGSPKGRNKHAQRQVCMSSDILPCVLCLHQRHLCLYDKACVQKSLAQCEQDFVCVYLHN